MNKPRIVLGLAVALVCASALGVAGVDRDDAAQSAFDATPQGAFILTVGATTFIPGFAFTADVETELRIDPFFTDNVIDIVIAPTFTADDRLETGLDFDGWSASVDVNVSLIPWSLTSTGGWFEFHPPVWHLLADPAVTVDGDLGWGPRWVPLQGWTHSIGGTLDVDAMWALPTVWSTDLELSAESDTAATWTFPGGTLAGTWTLEAGARSILPLLQGGPAALRASSHVQIGILPAFGLGFDIELEFRLNAFYAYATLGAGLAGVTGEIGVELSVGL